MNQCFSPMPSRLWLHTRVFIFVNSLNLFSFLPRIRPPGQRLSMLNSDKLHFLFLFNLRFVIFGVKGADFTSSSIRLFMWSAGQLRPRGVFRSRPVNIGWRGRADKFFLVYITSLGLLSSVSQLLLLFDSYLCQSGVSSISIVLRVWALELLW